MSKESYNRALRARRLKLKRAGICVDCQENPVRTAPPANGKKAVLCDPCALARRKRWKDGTMPPLFRAILKASDQVN